MSEDLNKWNPRKIDWLYNNIEWDLPIINLFEHCLADIRRNAFQKVNKICQDKNGSWHMTYVARETDNDLIYAIQLNAFYSKLSNFTTHTPYYKSSIQNIIFVDFTNNESLLESETVFYKNLSNLFSKIYEIPDVAKTDICKGTYYTWDSFEIYMDKLPIHFACPTLGHMIHLLTNCRDDKILFCTSSNIIPAKENSEDTLPLWKCYLRLDSNNLLEYIITDDSDEIVSIKTVLKGCSIGNIIMDTSYNTELNLLIWMIELIKQLELYNKICVCMQEHKSKDLVKQEINSSEKTIPTTKSSNIMEAEVTDDGIDIYVNIKNGEEVEPEKLISFKYDGIGNVINIYKYQQDSDNKESKLGVVFLNKHMEEIYNLRNSISEINKEIKIHEEIIKSLKENKDNNEKKLVELVGSPVDSCLLSN